MNSPSLNDRCSSSMSRGNSRKMLSMDSKEESVENSARESLTERSSKGEEDWRRRTIIIEKKNGSYGFTLQSYGIHYKKEQEIEMITYVDYVDKKGPAAAAGLREGDVILTINGTDMDRAEHKSIVDAINSCDSRMRMVVIFEDCVRKVELHIKYINLHKILQEKIKELDKLRIRERQILDTNWKTHSLPSQKKKNSPGDPVSDAEDSAVDNLNGAYCRSTLSSENVTSAPQQRVAFKYQYLDPRFGTCVIQPGIRTGNFVITVGSPRNRADCRQYIVKPQQNNHCNFEEQDKAINNGHEVQTHKSVHRHSCTQCISAYTNQDANSLEAYDLASPCCDPHCVPNAKKKHRRKREGSKEKRKEKTTYSQLERCYQKAETCQTRNKKPCSTVNCPGSRYRYLNADSAQTSQCSLQSCNNSTASIGQGNQPGDNTASSYTTSLSSDTLFWETDRSENKSSPKIQYQQSHQSHHKPKSWDNLTTKVVGGYGFGYGYLDTITKHVSRSKSHGRSHTSRSTQSNHGHQSHSHRQNTATPQHYSLYEHDHRNCFAPTKSTESLVVHSHNSENLLTCKWLDEPTVQGNSNSQIEYYRRPNAPKSPNDSRQSGYYSHHFVYTSHSCQKKKNPPISSEITRL